MPRLVPGRVPAARPTVVHDLAAVLAGPPELAKLARQERRPLRRVLPGRPGQAAPPRPRQLGHAQGLADLGPRHARLAGPLDVDAHTGPRRALQRERDPDARAGLGLLLRERRAR